MQRDVEAGGENRARALRELAIYYEHRERNYAMALEMTHSALALEDSADMRQRERRLRERAARAG